MHQIVLSASQKELEDIEPVLEMFEALSITLQDAADHPVLEPAPGETPIWPDVIITGLFSEEPDTAAMSSRLREAVGRDVEVVSERLPEQDWTRTWMDGFKPMRFGERLWICPSWHEPPDQQAVNILLDPGLAFGTGTHPTTALCLQWLDAHPPAQLQVIDYGCGSGILGIAALKLGADHVWAVDIDPQALLATRSNAANNGLTASSITCVLPEALPDVVADLLLANILSGPLVELAPVLSSMVKPGGGIVLSGLLAQQADDVTSVYTQWFDMQPPGISGEWILLAGRRKSV